MVGQADWTPTNSSHRFDSFTDLRVRCLTSAAAANDTLVHRVTHSLPLGRIAQLYADARLDAYTMSPMPSTIESPPYTAHFV